MKIYGFKNNEQGIMELKSTLKAEQAFVGGLIDVYSITDDLDIVFNDEGVING